MSKKRTRDSSAKPNNPSNENIAAKYGLIGTITVAVIGVIGVLITVYFNFRQAELPINATQTAEARLTSVALSALPTTSPTVSITDTPQPSATTSAVTASFVGYDFEEGVAGWQSSESEFKLAQLNTTSLVAVHGSQALVLDTELYGSGSQEFKDRDSEDVYRHTEALVYFDKIPDGYDRPGPYDLTGKRLSCFVYLPIGLVALNDGSLAYVRLILKDRNFANQFSEPVMIDNESIEHWLELIYVVNPDPNSDFDTTQVNAMGIRLDSLDGSTVSYKGSLYIDYCTISS